ncbi:methanol dehydrogenase [Altererythrobacter salegens]|uniref:Methanol dehydrogenase n=1 Tax=Croceibacterium salegens TaxID=1737568 RepID=A0A6I4STQ5_9SPHN|nr:TPM domain-containing protein [Croceibacterium salegens]MXO58286.1 methanol dehydrogenase [Croceibacterium salegens]
MARHVTLLFALFLSLTGSAALAAPDFPERGTAPVVDAANIIDDTDEALLSAKLDAFEQKNQRQFVVATVPSLDGYDIADYGYQLGRYWQLGDKGRNDGIILLVAPNERKVRIEVGYGLESVIPDGLAFDIINRDILPRFKNRDMTGGIIAGADAIIKQIELPPDQQKAAVDATQRQSSDEGFPIGAVIWMLFILFFFILPMFRRRRGRRYGVGSAIGDVILWNAINSATRGGSHHSSGGFGGFGGGGGGFSGGGGSFGGGGASGGW